VGAKLVGAGDVVTAAVEGNTNVISSLAAGRVCLSAVRPKKKEIPWSEACFVVSYRHVLWPGKVTVAE